ncbi:carbon storage regulator [Botrimarina mediterranea]|uniref:carbon storage regulator n=1 Tax=Botrimarina mediterranea TaxID=2528022 RepID=UPI0011A91F1A
MDDSRDYCLLSRRAGQSICIGHDIEVKVVSIDGDQIQLGVCTGKRDAGETDTSYSVRPEPPAATR